MPTSNAESTNIWGWHCHHCHENADTDNKDWLVSGTIRGVGPERMLHWLVVHCGFQMTGGEKGATIWLKLEWTSVWLYSDFNACFQFKIVSVLKLNVSHSFHMVIQTNKTCDVCDVWKISVHVPKVLGCLEFQIVIVFNLNIVNTIYMVIQINKENDAHKTFKMCYEYKCLRLWYKRH